MTNHWLNEIDSKEEDNTASENKTASKRYYYEIDSNNIYLTQRQMDIALLLLKNLTYKGIGKKLGIGDRTVECHTTAMRAKLNCSNKKALIAKLVELLSSESNE